MAVLVTCKFDDDQIKNEGAIVSTTFPSLNEACSEIIETLAFEHTDIGKQNFA